jgi:hypothetical protein
MDVRMTETLEPVFLALRQRMMNASDGMDVATDEPGNLVMKTPWMEPGKKEPAWFGAVQQKKRYVSYHLMPIYAVAGLSADIAPELQKRMQGKSCFNFRTIEADLFDALEALTRKCAAAYAQPTGTSAH